MADGTDNRNARAIDRVSDAFGVEGPKIVATPAAAADNHDINIGAVRTSCVPRHYLIEKANGCSDLLAGAVALDAYGTYPDFDGGPAAGENFEHVAHGGTARTGDQGHAAREARQRFLTFRGEISQPGEFFLELAQGQLQGPESF